MKPLQLIFPSLLAYLAILILALPRVSANEPAPDSVEEWRKLESQQGAEARKLGKVAGDVASLLDDLKSNGLLEQGGGKKVETFKEVIHQVAEDRLPAVATHLRNARLESDAENHHLKSADEEMDAIVAELGKVLAGSSAMLAGEALVEELKDMIKVQTLVRGKTAEWGKTMLISPETSGAGKGPLMQDQTTLLNRNEKFLEQLAKARDEAVDEATKTRFQQATDVLNPAKPKNSDFQEIVDAQTTSADILQAAITQIDAGDVLSAVGAQDAVTAVFKSALQILSSGQFDLGDFVAGLEKLIQKQKVLMTETEAEQDLANRVSFYEARQTEIRDEISKSAFDGPDLFVNKEGEYLVEPLMTSLTEAIDAIKAGEKETAVTAQKKVIALLESAYGTASMTTEEAEGESHWVNSPEIPEELFKLPPDGEEEDMELVDADIPEFFESDMAYELGIPEGGKGAAPGATAAAANLIIGLSEQEKETKGVTDEGAASVGHDRNPSGAGSNESGYANAIKKEGLARDSMQRQQQKAKIQDYVRQLPPEFRSQVADYYELISE
jgi:hypothetical protein